jgi:hypothetical protein
MRPKHVYFMLCLAGIALPYSQFIPFLREHGLNLALFFEQLFANRISGFFGLDVIVSSLVLWVFVLVDGRRNRMRHLWAPIAGNLAVGVSLGLPLFLYMREVRLEGSPMRFGS